MQHSIIGKNLSIIGGCLLTTLRGNSSDIKTLRECCADKVFNLVFSNMGIKWPHTMISCSEGLGVGDLLGFSIH